MMEVVRVRNSFYLTTVLRASEDAEYLKTLELVSPYCKILIYLIYRSVVGILKIPTLQLMNLTQKHGEEVMK